MRIIAELACRTNGWTSPSGSEFKVTTSWHHRGGADGGMGKPRPWTGSVRGNVGIGVLLSTSAKVPGLPGEVSRDYNPKRRVSMESGGGACATVSPTSGPGLPQSFKAMNRPARTIRAGFAAHANSQTRLPACGHGAASWVTPPPLRPNLLASSTVVRGGWRRRRNRRGGGCDRGRRFFCRRFGDFRF
jgi:hypothetical protein